MSCYFCQFLLSNLSHDVWNLEKRVLKFIADEMICFFDNAKRSSSIIFIIIIIIIINLLIQSRRPL